IWSCFRFPEKQQSNLSKLHCWAGTRPTLTFALRDHFKVGLPLVLLVLFDLGHLLVQKVGHFSRQIPVESERRSQEKHTTCLVCGEASVGAPSIESVQGKILSAGYHHFYERKHAEECVVFWCVL